MVKKNKGEVEKGKVELTESVLNRAEIPDPLKSAKIGKCPDVDVKDKVKTYINKMWEAYKQGLGLLFFGPPKTGKSGFASVIAKHALNRGYSVLFKRSSDIISKLINEENFDTKESYSQRFTSVDFLIIDDIQPSKNENRFSMLYDIIKRREDWSLPTIITTKIPEHYLYQYFPFGFEDTVEASFQPLKVDIDKWKDQKKEVREKIFGEYDNVD